MNDSRFKWIEHFSSVPAKTTVIIPKGIKGPVLESLKACWNSDLHPKIVENGRCYSPFVPLSKNIIYNEDCEVLIYLIQNRESNKSIQKKLIAEEQSTIAEYSIFPGPKNPRWFIPEWRSLGPGKMSRMVQPSTFIARTAVTVFRLLKGIKQTHFISPCRLIVTSKKKNKTPLKKNRSIVNFFQSNELGIRTGIVYTGSYGPLQKFTIELMKNNAYPFAYAKFGQNNFTSRAIHNEKSVLKKLNALTLKKVEVPKLLELSGIPDKFASHLLMVKTLEGGYPLTRATRAVVQGLLELYNATKNNNTTTLKLYIIGQIECLQKQNTYLNKKCGAMRDELIGIMKHLEADIGDQDILPVSLSHGDFTRWNVRGDEKKIYVIDWEEAAIRPAGHDLLSFLVAEYLLVPQATPEKGTPHILGEFSNGGFFDDYLNKIKIDDPSFDIDIKLLGLCFFIELFRSNLWHFRKHQQYHYPEKKSLTDLMETSWKCCLQLNKLRKANNLKKL